MTVKDFQGNDIAGTNSEIEKVMTGEFKKGDIVICKPGQKIAVDGEVVQGTTHINESFITGESVPVKREVGSKVIAGSINYEGTIQYRAEKIGKESTVSEIVKLVAQATSTKAPIAKIADTVIIREEADIDRFAEKLVRKINEQRIINNG